MSGQRVHDMAFGLAMCSAGIGVVGIAVGALPNSLMAFPILTATIHPNDPLTALYGALTFVIGLVLLTPRDEWDDPWPAIHQLAALGAGAIVLIIGLSGLLSGINGGFTPVVPLILMPIGLVQVLCSARQHQYQHRRRRRGDF